MAQRLRQFLQSYLIGFIFWLGITMGSLALLMVQYLSGGGWGIVSRRIFEASTRNLPLMVILFLPIALNLPVLYEWVRPEAAAAPEIHDKAAYLNVQFFLVRAVIFFGVWWTLAMLLNRWSKEQDDSAPRLPGPMAYIVYRTAYPFAWEKSSQELNVILGGVNTAVLICSSLTMVLAVRAAQVGSRRGQIVNLVLTILFGSTFLVIKYFEYAAKFEHHLVPGPHFGPTPPLPFGSEVFFSLYFIMAGRAPPDPVSSTGTVGALSHLL